MICRRRVEFREQLGTSLIWQVSSASGAYVRRGACGGVREEAKRRRSAHYAEVYAAPSGHRRLIYFSTSGRLHAYTGTSGHAMDARSLVRGHVLQPHGLVHDEHNACTGHTHPPEMRELASSGAQYAAC